MSAALANAHIVGQQRLREIVARAIAAGWTGLSGYDERDVDAFIERIAPLVLAGQRQSVALMDAYLARALERQPLGINADELTGAAVRNGTPPEEEWRRPFVTVWTALANGTRYPDAVGAGLARAQAMAATDMQLSMRGAAALIGEADPGIYGYQRVTDGHACTLCRIASTQRYHRGDLMPIHAHCGCSVYPLTDPSERIVDRGLYRQLKADGAIDKISAQRQVGGYQQRAAANRAHAEQTRAELASETDPARRARIEARARSWEQRADAQDLQAAALEQSRAAAGTGITAAVRDHGEIGPVLVNAAHNFDLL